MEKSINEVKISDLTGDTYLIKVPIEIMDLGYTYCNEVLNSLKFHFPGIVFVMIPEQLKIQETDKNELENLRDEIDTMLKKLEPTTEKST